jgi:hypothetical protein
LWVLDLKTIGSSVQPKANGKYKMVVTSGGIIITCQLNNKSGVIINSHRDMLFKRCIATPGVVRHLIAALFYL